MEIPAPTFCELQKNVSRVQLISDPQRMAELCAEVGNIWTPEVHHMNGQIYTVVENLPPNKYAVYDPVCGKKGLQGGKIFVPSKAVTVVDEQVEPPHAWCELQPHVARVQLISDVREMGRFCQEVGNSWGSMVHHMNGQTYTVVENHPPNKYAVYDPVCEAKGLQGGIIYVPWKGITALEEDNFAASELMERFQRGLDRKDKGDPIEIDIKTPQGDHIDMSISSSSTVAECLWQVVNETGVVFNRSVLHMGGEPLGLEDSLSASGVEGGAHLTLVDSEPHQVSHLKSIVESMGPAAAPVPAKVDNSDTKPLTRSRSL